MDFKAVALVAALVLANGCAVRAPEACRDFLQAIGDTAERCGDDRAIVEAAIEDDLRAAYGAGCNGADRIRDVDDFYDVCIPFIEALTCAEYAGSVSFPPECLDQLLYEM